jgi:hypothetical protein
MAWRDTPPAKPQQRKHWQPQPRPPTKIAMLRASAHEFAQSTARLRQAHCDTRGRQWRLGQSHHHAWQVSARVGLRSLFSPRAARVACHCVSIHCECPLRAAVVGVPSSVFSNHNRRARPQFRLQPRACYRWLCTMRVPTTGPIRRRIFRCVLWVCRADRSQHHRRLLCHRGTSNGDALSGTPCVPSFFACQVARNGPPPPGPSS